MCNNTCRWLQLDCFEQRVPWHSGNYRVWIHSEMRTWHDNNIQSIHVGFIRLFGEAVAFNQISEQVMLSASMCSGKMFYVFISFQSKYDKNITGKKTKCFQHEDTYDECEADEIYHNNAIDLVQMNSVIGLCSLPNSLELFYLCQILKCRIAEKQLCDEFNHVLKTGCAYEC